MRLYLFIALFIVSINSFAQEKISGVVQDKVSRHTLVGANVYFLKSKSGATTDKYGRFKLTLSSVEGDTLFVSYMGYTGKQIPARQLYVGQKTNYIDLERSILILDELRVEANRFEDEIRSLSFEPGSVRLNFKDIRTVPYTVYPDINRSLQFLPGVISTHDLTSELNVRGGSPDQNLVLLEGVPVYYPFHVFGIASAFNADLVGEVQFSPGGFSVQYGNRLSSVMNIRTHTPQKPLELSADISFLGADLTASGRWKNKLEWLVSGRKSYCDILFKNLGNGIPYSFYDFFAKLAYKPDSDNTFSVMFFDFKDRYSEKSESESTLHSPLDIPNEYITYKETYEGRFHWRNRLYSFAWDRRFFSDLSVRAQIYQSVSGNIFDTDKQSIFPDEYPPEYEPLIQAVVERDKENIVYVDNDMTDRSALLSFNWKYASNFSVLGGIQHTIFQTNYGWGNKYLPFTPLYNYQDHIGLYFDYAPQNFDYQKKVVMETGYGEMLWDFANKYHLRAGLRATTWSNHSDFALEPRLNLRYDFNNNWSAKLACGRFTQGLVTSLEESMVGFLRLYFPVGDSLDIEKATHYVCNVEYNAGEEKQVSLSAFIKNYDGLLKVVGPGPDFIRIPGQARGLEFSAKSRLFGWKSWLALTYSRTHRTIDSIQYDTNWDQRYRLDLYAAKNIGKRWTFSWTWVLYSGVPYVADYYASSVRYIGWSKGPAHQDFDLYDLILIDVPPGKIRFPWYHRLDISLEKEFHFSTWHLNVYFSVRNLYARRNVLYYTEPGTISYDTKDGQYVDYYIKHPFKWLPRIPSIGFRVVF